MLETPDSEHDRLIDGGNLLDEIVGDFIELVKEYHLNGWCRPEDRDVKKCHLCQKLAKAEAYRDLLKKARQ